MRYFITMLLVLSAVNVFSQESDPAEGREPFTLELMVNDESYYSTHIPESKFIVKPNEIIQLFPGDDIYVEAARENSKILLIKVYRTVEDPEKYIHMKFEQVSEEKMHKYMLLTISNPFECDIIYSADILMLMNNIWINTSILPVYSGVQSFEMWNDIIISIALYDFKEAE